MLPSNYSDNFNQIQEPKAKPLWVSEFESMALHTQRKGAEKLIKKRRPNEPDDVHNYRKENFEHITNQAITRAINNLQRYFTQSRAVVKGDPETEDYLTQPIFEGVNFQTYMSQSVVNRMIEDPNGLLVWWPENVGDVTERVQPKPLLVLSRDIQHLDRKTGYCTFLSQEKSPLEGPKQETEYTGKVYYIVSTDGYYKYTETGKKGKTNFVLSKYYDQEFKQLPIIVLGGERTVEIIKNKEMEYLSSFFSGFVPFGNECLRQWSDHQAIMITSAYPIREVVGVDCLECNGKGTVRNEETKDKIRCTECLGTGSRMPVSPYGFLIKQGNKGSALNPQAEIAEAIKFVSPPVDILKYSGEHWQDLLLLAEKAINLNYIDEAQSGIAKEIDRENLTAMLDRIGMNLYQNIVRNTYIIVSTLLNMESPDNVTVILPNSFRIRSESDLVKELNELVEKDAPLYLITEVALELTRKRYAGDESLLAAVEKLAVYDPYFALPVDRKQDLYVSGALLWSEFRRSLLSYNAAMQVQRQAENFTELSADQFKKQMDAIIEPQIGEPGGGVRA